MMQRVLIEFVVDVPNMDVASDVETRIRSEQAARLCDVLRSVTGYQPLQAPDRPGLYCTTEPVTWNEVEQDWQGQDDVEDALVV